jgi:hypothetical protein
MQWLVAGDRWWLVAGDWWLVKKSATGEKQWLVAGERRWLDNCGGW